MCSDARIFSVFDINRLYITVQVMFIMVVTQCNGSCGVEALRRIAPKPVVRSESCPSRAASYLKEVPAETSV